MKEKKSAYLLDLTGYQASVLSMALLNYVRKDCPEPEGIQQELLEIIRRLDDMITETAESSEAEMTLQKKADEPDVVFYEDSGGGIHAVVKVLGMLYDVIPHLERERGLTGAEILAAADKGFVCVDPYAPEKWGGLEMSAAADEIAATAKPIVEIYHRGSVNKTVFIHGNMGVEGNRLFGQPRGWRTPELGSL